jgi:large subunit ribosomal protein L18
MTTIAIKRREARARRHNRVRTRVSGTPQKPRLCVYRSLSHIYAQLVDDSQGRTLLTVSSLTPEVREQLTEGKAKKTAVSAVVGQVIARKALDMGIQVVAFDRGGYLYHGRVKALADGAREGGLKF